MESETGGEEMGMEEKTLAQWSKQTEKNLRRDKSEKLVGELKEEMIRN